jgi:hypothetical protein
MKQVGWQYADPSVEARLVENTGLMAQHDRIGRQASACRGHEDR